MNIDLLDKLGIDVGINLGFAVPKKISTLKHKIERNVIALSIAHN